MVSQATLQILLLLGFLLSVVILLGIGFGITGLSDQIKARREEPRRMADAETRRLNAAIKLEEKRIERLELEVKAPLDLSTIEDLR